MKKNTNHFVLIQLFIFNLFVSNVNAQWVTAGPEGGIIRCSTASGDTLFTTIGWYGSGLYASYNQGDSWQNISNTFLPTDINTILKVGNSLFLGCGGPQPGSVGVYRSDDNGQTWHSKTNIESSVQKMGAYGSTIYAITSWNGILRSVDNGENWLDVTGNLPTIDFAYGLVATSDAVYVSLYDYGVWRLPNSGNIWEPAYNGIPQYARVLSLALIGNDLYAGTDAYGLYRSKDGGNNWTNLDPVTTNAYYDYEEITGDNTVIFAATARNGILRSTDNGVTWTVENNGIEVYDGAKSLLKTGEYFFIGTKSGMYRTADSGNHWVEANSGLCAHNMQGGPFTIGSDMFAGSRYGGGVYKSSDNGISWTNVSAGLPINTDHFTYFMGNSTSLFAFDMMSNDHGESWTLHNSPGRIEVGSGLPWIEQDGSLFTYNYNDGHSGIYRSSDNGQTWTTINNGINPWSGSYLTMHSVNNTLLTTTLSSGAYYSTDNGDNWSPAFFDVYGAAIIISPVINGSTVFCGLGQSNVLGGIYKSEDNFATWVKVHNLNVHKIIVSEGNIYASGTLPIYGQEVPHIFLSQDNGNSWTKISTSLGNQFYTQTFTVEGSKLFVSSTAAPDYVIYFSSDNGTHWINAGQGLPARTLVTSFTVSGNEIFSATYANSLWRRNLSAFDLPLQPEEITGQQNPCIGSIETYSVEYVPDVTYNWQFPSDWTLIDGGNTNIVTVNTGNLTGIVLVTPSTLAGNGPSQYLFVSPQSTVAPEVTISSNLNDVCGGTMVSFEIEETGGGDNPEFGWYVNGIAVASGPNYSFIPSDGDHIKVEMLSDLPCAINNPAISNIVEMIVNPLPQAPVIVKSGDTLISDYPDGNQWFYNGILIEGATNDTLKAIAYGTYYSIVTIDECQSEPSNSIVAAPLTIEKPDNIDFGIYPVPSNGVFTVSQRWSKKEQVNLKVFNKLGLLVFETEFSTINVNESKIIDIRPVPDGIYIIKLSAGLKTVVGKIMVIN